MPIEVDLLVGRNFVEEFRPALEVTLTEAVAMSDNPVRAYCNLGRLRIDLQCIEHAFISRSCDPGQAVALSISFKSF